MTEIFISAFITLFVVIDPPGCAPIYAGLTKGATSAQQRVMAIRACAIASVILLLAPLLLRFRSVQKTDPLLLLWQNFVRKLGKAGFVSEASMGPMELAANASSQMRHKEDDILEITELYVLCRYSRGTGNQTELAALIKGFKASPVPH